MRAVTRGKSLQSWAKIMRQVKKFADYLQGNKSFNEDTYSSYFVNNFISLTTFFLYLSKNNCFSGSNLNKKIPGKK